MSNPYNLRLILIILILANGLLGDDKYSYHRKYGGGRVELTPDYGELIVRFKTDIEIDNIQRFGNEHNLAVISIRRGGKGFVAYRSNDRSRGRQFLRNMAASPDVARLTPIFTDQFGVTLRFVPGRILVQFSEATSTETSEEIIDKYNLNIVTRHFGHGFDTIEVPGTGDTFIQLLYRD